MAEFKEGDVVVMISGGPRMTVVEFGDYSPTGPEDGVKCTWFEGNTRFTETIARVALKPYERGASGTIQRA